jgi:hypothetical protein
MARPSAAALTRKPSLVLTCLNKVPRAAPTLMMIVEGFNTGSGGATRLRGQPDCEANPRDFQIVTCGLRTMSVATALPPSKRDLRLDLFRGLGNWAMFLGHIPSTVLAWLTFRNYGFSDGADLFVFISGYTSASVYTRRMSERGFVFGATRLLKRDMCLRNSSPQWDIRQQIGLEVSRSRVIPPKTHSLRRL